MIQLNLMKEEVKKASVEVEAVYRLTREIQFTMLSDKTADQKHFDVLELTAKIMALTQGLE